MSPAFISSVMINAPHATLVFDHSHVIKLMNDALDEICRSVYREEKDLNKRKSSQRNQMAVTLKWKGYIR